MLPIGGGAVTTRILVGDVRERLADLSDQSVHCCVTSPPYYNLRDYGVPGQIGLESSLSEYLTTMVKVFRDVRRVLRDDGTLWLNIGDSYASAWPCNRRNVIGSGSLENGKRENRAPRMPDGLKEKDLMMVPARLAIALQDDGWYVRMDNIWEKPNAMPESAPDRPTKSHEYVYLLSKSRRYYYNKEAVSVPASTNTHSRGHGLNPKAMKVPTGWDTAPGSHGTIHREGRTKQDGHGRRHAGFNERYKVKQNESFAAATNGHVETRNLRSVWTILTKGFPEAHFATYPPELVEICIKAGSPEGGTILDPFVGSGTTLMVADRLKRHGIGIELNPEYAAMAERRIRGDAPMFADVTIEPATRATLDMEVA